MGQRKHADAAMGISIHSAESPLEDESEGDYFGNPPDDDWPILDPEFRRRRDEAAGDWGYEAPQTKGGEDDDNPRSEE